MTCLRQFRYWHLQFKANSHPAAIRRNPDPGSTTVFSFYTSWKIWRKFLTFICNNASLHCFIFLVSVISVIISKILDSIFWRIKYALTLHLAEMATFPEKWCRSESDRIRIHNTEPVSSKPGSTEASKTRHELYFNRHTQIDEITRFFTITI
jgi:hypothetical protein